MSKTLIIGASSGIGAALAATLEREGNELVVWNRHSPQHLKKEFRFSSVDVLLDDPLPSIDETLDHLIYCPGNIRLKPFGSLKEEDFILDFRLNVMGAVKIIRHVLPALKKSTHASILLFSTVAVQTGMPFHSSITTSKGAIEGLVRSLAAEFAPRIRVNCIAPSLTATPLAAPLLNNEIKYKSALERHPLKKIGSPDDIASLASFLISENAQFITGQIWKVDGGIGSLKTG